MKASEIIETSLVREARKNPKLNPKISVNEYIKQHLDKAKDIPGTRVKNSFVSFTEVDKLGIKPGSGYNTPLGIYSYPSSYVVASMGSDMAMSFLPFAGDNPYANIFSAQGNIIDLSTMGDRELGNYNRKMVDVFIKTAGITPGSGEWKTNVDILENIFIRAPAEAKISSPGGKFWFITMEFANLLMTAEQTRRQWRSGQHRVSWNKLFREIGVDGCIDSGGDGIIHTSEPVQAVFFSIKSIDKNQRVDNRYSPADQKTSIAIGKDKRKKAKIASSMSEDEQVELVRDHYLSIKHIRKPSEKVQLAAVEHGGFFALEYIRKPTEKVQLAAVEKDPISLKYIKNPSDKAQLAAVKSGGGLALEYIRKPTEKVQLAAVERDRAAVMYIQNPSEKVQLAAVEKDPFAVMYIQNPSEKVQIAAVGKDPAALKYIKNPSDKVKAQVRKIFQALKL